MADKKVQLHDSAGNNLYPMVNVDQIYPVGSVYISINTTNPGTIFGGTWSKIGAGRTLMGAPANSNLGTTVNSGLPDIQGKLNVRATNYNSSNIAWAYGSPNALGVTQNGGSGSADTLTQYNGASTMSRLDFAASSYNSIYGASTIVQPPAYYVNFWLRTA